MTRTREEQAASPGSWQEDFPIDADRRVEEGLVVWSQSGIEGRTTGGRARCLSSETECQGWFIDVSWETGQHLRPCSMGWHYNAATKVVRITGGGDISARFVSPEPLGVDPLPTSQWPDRSTLARGRGWRVTPPGPVPG